jgi:hypothetical protein
MMDVSMWELERREVLQGVFNGALIVYGRLAGNHEHEIYKTASTN